MNRLLSIVLLFCVFPHVSSHAVVVVFPEVEVVYDNEITSVNNGRVNDPSFPSFLIHADDFHIDEAVTINRFDWWGAYKGFAPADGSDDFTLRLHRIDGGVAQVEPFATFELENVSRNVEPSVLLGGRTVFAYGADFDDVDLEAGGYLVSIMNNPDGSARWMWADRDSSPGTSYIQSREDGAWREFSGNGVAEFAFSVSHVVPEPSLLGSLAVGLALFSSRRRRDA